MGAYEREFELALSAFSTPFDAVKGAEQFTQFSLNPSLGYNKRRYHYYSNGDFYNDTNLSNVESGIRLETTATGSDSVRLRSNLSGQYIAQALCQAGVGMIVDDSNTSVDADTGESSISHGEIYAGAFWWDGGANEIDTGLAFRWTPSGLDFIVKSNGAHIGDSPISQAEFNEDPFDGDGDSGVRIDPGIGYVYNWPFTWYNQGPLGASLLNPQSNRVEAAHLEVVEGRPSTDTPNFPTQVVIRNNGTAQALGVEVGGMQYSTYGAGLDDIEYRETDVVRTTEGAGYISAAKSVDATTDLVDATAEPGVPLVAFQRASGFREMATGIQEFELRPVDDDVYIYEWDEYDPSTALTGNNFVSPTTQESGVLIDTEATDYTPGSNSILRSVKFFEAGQKNQTGSLVETRADTRVPSGATRVITAVNDGDSATADADPVLVKIEEAY